MSIQYCHVCCKNIDTDYNAEHFIYEHPTHCKYDQDTEAVKQCVLCGEGLCSGCGFTLNGETYCNECYAEVRLVKCGTCGKQVTDPIDKEFTLLWGMCLGCDHVQGEVNDYMAFEAREMWGEMINETNSMDLTGEDYQCQ